MGQRRVQIRKRALVNGHSVGMPKTYPAGRRCADCGCLLSIYNRTDTCGPCSRKDEDEGNDP
jgi:hypothetical protein